MRRKTKLVGIDATGKAQPIYIEMHANLEDYTVHIVRGAEYLKCYEFSDVSEANSQYNSLCYDGIHGDGSIVFRGIGIDIAGI